MQITEWFSHSHDTGGLTVFAIGDIHGVREPMDALLGAMRELARDLDTAGTDLVWLGDVIDRGPDSADCLSAYLADDPAFERVVRLCGNHEQLMMLALGYSPKHRTGQFGLIRPRFTLATSGSKTAVALLPKASSLQQVCPHLKERIPVNCGRRCPSHSSSSASIFQAGSMKATDHTIVQGPCFSCMGELIRTVTTSGSLSSLGGSCLNGMQATTGPGSTPLS